jgi:hypothetical protein
MGPYVDYNLTLSRLQHIYFGQPYAESTLTLCQSRRYPQVRDLGFNFYSCVEEYTDGQRCLARDLDFDLCIFGETKMVHICTL